MKRTTIALIAVALVAPALSSQPAGLMFGLEYHGASLQNPYVGYSGSIVEPTDLEEYDDAADYLFFPFGYKAISEQGYAEVSTYALNALLGYVGGLLSGRSTYEQYFRSDEASIFRPTLDNDPNKFYVDQDLLSFAVSGALLEGWPLLGGIQGGLGNRGINPPGTGSTGEGPGVVGFDDDAVVYGGVNGGLGLSIASAYVQGLAYYDWYYLLNKESTDGNTLTFDVHLLPFYATGSVLEGLFVKGAYRLGWFGYYQRFAESLPVEYGYSRFTLGLGYIL